MTCQNVVIRQMVFHLHLVFARFVFAVLQAHGRCE